MSSVLDHPPTLPSALICMPMAFLHHMLVSWLGCMGNHMVISLTRTCTFTSSFANTTRLGASVPTPPSVTGSRNAPQLPSLTDGVMFAGLWM